MGFAGTGPAAVPAALALRISLFAPPPPSATGEIPAITRTAFEVQQHFVSGVGDVSPAPLYAAIRSARRGIAANPADAGTFLSLGRCYLQLQDGARERDWAARFPLLGQLRLVQASAALNRAAALNPALPAAHLELALLYRRMNCGDLAVTHLKAYRELTARSGRPVDPRASDETMERLIQLLDRHAKSLATEAGRASSADRAQMAARRGLAGEALRLLLESDVSSFGTQGMRLELDLLLKTGRAADLLAWATPELREPLGAGTYHWMRAQAHLAVGDYSAADVELGAVTESPLVPASAGPIAGRIAAKAVLDTRPASVFLPDLLWRALSQNDFRAESLALERSASNQCDIAAVRGLMALEVGDAARAADAFRTALEFSRRDGPWKGFSFPAEPVAVTGLKWLGLEAAR